MNVDPARCEISQNTFLSNPELKLTDKDFMSADDKELLMPRQANGELPNIEFGHPAEGSALIDGGVDVGFPFRGAKPDLGAFER